jgi:hypothetical protein
MKKLLCWAALGLCLNCYAQNAPRELWIDIRLRLVDRYVAVQPIDSILARAQTGGRWGLIDRSGREILAPRYDRIDSLSAAGTLTVALAGRSGVIDRQGREILPPQYGQIIYAPLGYAAQDDTAWLFFDRSGRQLSRMAFRGVRQLAGDTVVAVTAAGMVGAWRTDGRDLLPDSFHTLERLPDGRWRAGRFGQRALLDPAGRPQTPYIFYDVVPLPDGRLVASFWENEPYFFVDRRGQLLSKTPVVFNTMPGGRYWIVQDTLRGLLEADGRFRPAPGAEGQGIAVVADRILVLRKHYEETNDDAFWLYDLHERRAYPQTFEVASWSDRRIVAAGADSVFAFNHRLEVISRQFFRAYELTGSWIWGHNYGAIDTGLQALWRDARVTRVRADGLAVVYENERIGFFTAHGRAIFPPKFEMFSWPEDWAELYFAFREATGVGLFNLRGEVVVPAQYEDAVALTPDRFKVRRNGYYAVVDRRGRPVWDFEYNDILLRHGLLLLIKDYRGSWGTLDGEPVEGVDDLSESEATPAGDTWSPNEAGLFIRASPNGKTGLHTATGHALWPPVYDQLVPLRFGEVAAAVRQERRGALLGSDRRVQFEFEVDTLLESRQGFLLYRQAGGTWLLNTETHAKIAFEHEQTFWTYHRHLDLLVLNNGDDPTAHLFDARLNRLYSPVPGLVNPCDYFSYLIVDNQRGHSGLLQRTASSVREVLPLQYQQGERGYSGGDWLRLWSNDKQGIFDLRHHRMLPVEFDRIDELGDLLAVWRGERCALYDRAFRRLTDFEFDGAHQVTPRAIILRRHGQAGVVDSRVRTILPLEFDQVWLNETPWGERYFELQKAGLSGVARLDGSIFLPVKFSSIRPYRGAWHVQIDQKFGVYGRDGHEVVAPVYENWQELPGFAGLWEVRIDGKIGLRTDTGREVLPSRYDGIEYYGRVAVVRQNNRFGLIDLPLARTIVPVEYELLQGDYPGNAFFLAKRDGRFSYLDADGRSITALEFEIYNPFRSGLAPVRYRDRWGFLDTLGRFAIEPQFDYAEHFRAASGHAIVLKDSAYRFIDRRGRFVERRFDHPVFEYGLQVVYEPGAAYHLRNPYGQTLLTSQDGIGLYANAGLLLYWAPNGDRCPGKPVGLMDYSGRKLTGLIYDSISVGMFAEFDLVPARRDGKAGYLNRLGQEVIAFRYDVAQPFCRDEDCPGGVRRAVVTLNGKQIAIDEKGRCLENCD